MAKLLMNLICSINIYTGPTTTPVSYLAKVICNQQQQRSDQLFHGSWGQTRLGPRNAAAMQSALMKERWTPAVHLEVEIGFCANFNPLHRSGGETGHKRLSNFAVCIS